MLFSFANLQKQKLCAYLYCLLVKKKINIRYIIVQTKSIHFRIIYFYFATSTFFL